MRVAIMPNAFRGGPSARRVAAALAEGVRRAEPGCEAIEAPLSDGGDGALATAADLLGGTLVTVPVRGPLGAPVDARLLRTPDGGALIAMAEASGLALVPPGGADPLRASSYGTGELIAHAVAAGARRVIVTAGGSATADMGAGALAALGVRFLDGAGRSLEPCPADLGRVATVDASGLHPGLAGVELTVLSDVWTPLEANVARFGPQKGVSPAAAEVIERQLRALERALGAAPRTLLGRRWLGAGGGLPAGLSAVLGARVVSGSAWFLEHGAAALEGADLALTAEGRFDASSLEGKLPFAVAHEAARRRIPAVAVVASADHGATLSPHGALVDLGLPRREPGDVLDQPLHERLAQAAANAVRRTAERCRRNGA